MRILDRHVIELLRAVLERRSERRNASIAVLASKITRWEELIGSARQHRIAPMLYLELMAAGAMVPPEIGEVLRSDYERNAFHCIANSAELAAVLKEFDQAGIDCMPFKGVVLGASVYGEITERSAGDLDLLIRHRDLQKAAQILIDRGYTLTTKVGEDGLPEPEHYYEYHFDRSSDGMVLELRWRLELTQPRFRQVLGLEWCWPRRRMVTVGGETVPCVDPISNLLVLCMHGTKHCWSRLMWVSDVARLLESQPALDWVRVEKEAKRLGLWRATGLGVVLAQRVAGASVPAEVLRKFEKDASVRSLADFFTAQMIQEPGTRPPGRLPYSIQILDSSDRAAVVLSPTFLRPTPQDRAAIKLPRRLEALYYVIRPFRILLDRTARG